jgi:hypothetical protein
MDVEPTSQCAAELEVGEPCTNICGTLLNDFLNFGEYPSTGEF